MLHWRLLIGVPLVAFLVGICWLDARAPIPGVVLMPFFLVCVFFLCREIMALLHAGGIYPRRSTVYLGIFGTIILSWLSCYNTLPFFMHIEDAFFTALHGKSHPTVALVDPQTNAYSGPAINKQGAEAVDLAARALVEARNALETAENALLTARNVPEDGRKADEKNGAEIREAENGEVNMAQVANEQGWNTAAFAGIHILLAIAAGVLIAFVGEMLRFKQPGGNIINLTGAVFAIVYIGLLGSFMVMLRLAYGIAAVVSMIIVTKLCDIGAYTVGRLIGRHKMAPSLSPGKTIEGGCGGVAFSILGAWFSVAVLFPMATGRPSETTWLGVIIYGVAVGISGAIGDLAESLIKRDVMRKDSGVNVPGFGGFLDIFDSLLVAAPVAFALWAFHVVQ